MKLRWVYFPKSSDVTLGMKKIIGIFEKNYSKITSESNKKSSDEILRVLSQDLIADGFAAETGKGKEDKIRRPVFYGENSKIHKSFEVDAYYHDERLILEIEAGRAVLNYHFLKDLFEACIVPDSDYLVIAVRQNYLNRNDFEIVSTFFDTLYSSRRLLLPLKGVLLVGY